MMRTQIQLTEEQVRALKAWSAAEGRSMADLIRMCIDRGLPAVGRLDAADRGRRALAAVGFLHGGPRTLSEGHDAHLAEAYE
jgi:hypothetical protein